MTTRTKTTYTLTISNSSGANEETRGLVTKADVRRQIRTWDAKGMLATVRTSEGEEVYSGSALSF
jgi:hypothetical protein